MWRSTRPDAAALAGSVTDDGLPDPPGAVTAAWSKVTGPGTVAFADATAASTTATFTAAGSYVLRLTGNDGALQAVDDVTVTVTDGVPGPTNAAPVVDAGPDVAVTRPTAAALAGSVTDDGLPNPPGLVTDVWSKVSGPGTVAFADASAASTTATFTAAGSYVLRLTGDDGALTVSDDVTVTVSDPAPPPGSFVLDVPVRVSADDAEERISTGAVTVTSGDLNLGTDATRPQIAAMRFTGVTLPPGRHRHGGLGAVPGGRGVDRQREPDRRRRSRRQRRCVHHGRAERLHAGADDGGRGLDPRVLADGRRAHDRPADARPHGGAPGDRVPVRLGQR